MARGRAGSGAGGAWVGPRAASAAASDTDGAPGVPPGSASTSASATAASAPASAAGVGDAPAGHHAARGPRRLDPRPQPLGCALGRPRLVQRIDHPPLALVERAQLRRGGDPRLDLGAASRIERAVGERREVGQLGRVGLV